MSMQPWLNLGSYINHIHISENPKSSSNSRENQSHGRSEASQPSAMSDDVPASSLQHVLRNHIHIYKDKFFYDFVFLHSPKERHYTDRKRKQKNKKDYIDGHHPRFLPHEQPQLITHDVQFLIYICFS